MDRRSEAGDKIIEWVKRHRADPELKCPEHLCTILWLDPAGEKVVSLVDLNRVVVLYCMDEI